MLVNGEREWNVRTDCMDLVFSCKTYRFARFELKITSNQRFTGIDVDRIEMFFGHKGNVIKNITYHYNGRPVKGKIKLEPGESIICVFEDYSRWDEDFVHGDSEPKLFVVPHPNTFTFKGSPVQIDTIKIWKNGL